MIHPQAIGAAVAPVRGDHDRTTRVSKENRRFLEISAGARISGENPPMLSASIVALLLLAAIGAAVGARFSWRSLLVSAGVLELLGFVLLGLPGAAFLETLDPIMRRLGRGPIAGDAAWPAAIMMSMVWPVALAPAYLAARSVRAGRPQQGLAALAVLVLICVLLAALVYAFAA